MGEPLKHVHTYQARRPEGTVLYKVFAEHIETFIAQRETDGKGLPEFVVKELRGYLRCGILQYDFLCTKCKSCDFERAVPFSCKGRGFCPSCCGKRMAEKAYQPIDNVLPDVPYRQWVLSLPIRVTCLSLFLLIPVTYAIFMPQASSSTISYCPN